MDKIKLPGNTPLLAKGSRWMVGNMMFNVPLSGIAAINEMQSAAAVLRDRKDLYNQQLKQRVNKALQAADRYKALLKKYSVDPNAIDEFTDNIVDVTADCVAQLRQTALRKLQEKSIQDADMIAWVATAGMLLHLAQQHYQIIIAKGRKNYGYDYSRHFPHLKIDNVLEAWMQVEVLINPAPDVIASDEVIKQLQEVCVGYREGTYLNACINLMRHHPFFADMKATKDKGE